MRRNRRKYIKTAPTAVEAAPRLDACADPVLVDLDVLDAREAVLTVRLEPRHLVAKRAM